MIAQSDYIESPATTQLESDEKDDNDINELKSLIYRVSHHYHHYIPTSQNNQNTVLLTMPVCIACPPTDEEMVGGNGIVRYSCLLHDNRIFVFKKKNDDNNNNNDDQVLASSSVEQNLILNLLTTQKYRALDLLYSFFRLMDNITLLCVIVLSVINHQESMIYYDITLFSIIGVDIFYKIIDQAHKYWILQRLSIYISLLFFVVYSFIIYYKVNKSGSSESTNVIIIIVALRLLAFVLEECVDVSIDGELDIDLTKMQMNKHHLNELKKRKNNNKMKTHPHSEGRILHKKSESSTSLQAACVIATVLLCCVLMYCGGVFFLSNQFNKTDICVASCQIAYIGSSLLCFLLLFSWLNCCDHSFKHFFHNELYIPEELEYEGSFFGWGPGLVYEQPWKTTHGGCWGGGRGAPGEGRGGTHFPRVLSLALCFLPAWLSMVLLVPLGVFCLIVLAIPLIVIWSLRLCCCLDLNKKLENFKKEIQNF